MAERLPPTRNLGRMAHSRKARKSPSLPTRTPGYEFVRWSRASGVTDNPIKLVMSGSITLVAFFAVIPPTPTATPVPTATATPAPTPAATPAPAVSGHVGPINGVLLHEDDGLIEEHSSGVELADAIIEARIYNPYSTSEGSWSNGLLLRGSSANTFYAVVVTSSGFWHHVVRTGTAESSTELQTAFSSDINTGVNGSNYLRVIVLGVEGRLFINDKFTATLDLSTLTAPGDVSVITGYFTGDEVAGKNTQFEDFSVWPIQDEYGPSNGDIIDVPGNIDGNDSGIVLADTIAEARFFNPHSTSEGSWSTGFLIRNSAFNTFQAVFVRSGDE